MIKTAIAVLSGNIFNAFALFVRNMLLAHLLSVKDYGIASTFSISMAVVEMMTSLGLHHMIVQSESGNDPKMQSALQGFNLIRSFFSGLVLYLLAHPIAVFLGTEEVTWAYQALAIVPVLGGLMHFDVYRLNRQMIYAPLIMTYALSATLSILLIWPLYYVFADYRIMLFVMIGQHVMAMLFSQYFAQRKYQLSIDRAVVRNAFQFGWPLLIDSILLFAIFNGEKLIVGHELSIEDLAVFTLGFSLTIAPTLIVARSIQSFFLPQLSAAKNNPVQFRSLSMTTIQCTLLAGSVCALSIYFLGAPFITYLLGDKYLDVLPLLPLLAVFQSLRVLKGGITTVAVSKGNTKIPMILNIVRVASLPIAWYVVANSHSLFALINIGIIGEVISLICGMWLLKRWVGFSIWTSILPTILSMLVFVIMGMYVWTNTSLAHIGWTSSSLTIGMLVVFAASVVTMKELGEYFRLRVVTRYEDP